jgi:hypothetical protein
MDNNDDLFGQWLAAHRQNLTMRPLGRDELPSAPGLLIQCLCRLRLFWLVVGALLWMSNALLRVTSKLYFSEMLPPRATRGLLRLSSRCGEAALAMMRRRRRWNGPDASRRYRRGRP